MIPFDLWPLKIAVVFAGMSWLQVSCFLQSQIFTVVAVKSGPVCKPAIHMGYAETAFPVVKYNFTYLYLPIPSLSIPDHLISAGVLSGIAILTKTGGNCVLSYGKLASHSDQARTDRHKSSSLLLTSKYLWSIFQDWHQFTSLFTDTSEKVSGVSKRLLRAVRTSWYQQAPLPGHKNQRIFSYQLHPGV